MSEEWRECTVVSGESGLHSVECNPQRCPDILFTITIKIMSEEWRDSLLNFNNLEYQNLEKKILKNVRDFYGNNSPIRRMKVLKLWQVKHPLEIIYDGDHTAGQEAHGEEPRNLENQTVPDKNFFFNLLCFSLGREVLLLSLNCIFTTSSTLV